MSKTIQSAQAIFKRPLYTLLAIGVAGVLLYAFIWFPNWELLLSVVTSGASTATKLSIFLSGIVALSTAYTAASAVTLVLVAVLAGLYVATFVYLLRYKGRVMRRLAGTHSAGVGGFVSGLLGVGCAACGSLLLTPVLTLLGVGGVLAWLPFGGAEFGMIGVLVLGYALYLLLKTVVAPVVCK